FDAWCGQTLRYWPNGTVHCYVQHSLQLHAEAQRLRAHGRREAGDHRLQDWPERIGERDRRGGSESDTLRGHDTGPTLAGMVCRSTAASMRVSPSQLSLTLSSS